MASHTPTPLAQLVNSSFYFAAHPAAAASGLSALDHYLSIGWKLGYDPNPYFSTSAYLADNPDVAAAGVNPLVHWANAGWYEGRSIAPGFDTAYYLAQNPDVAAAGIDPLLHFITAGAHEHRDPNALFSSSYYLAHNPDVAAAGVDPYQHFLTSGGHEGRSPSALFDSAFYLAHNPDVAAAGVNPLLHFQAYGWKEGRDPNNYFSIAAYKATYPDIAAAGINPYTHYLNYGWREGRDASPAFSTSYYLAHNPDVAATGQDPFVHWLTYGRDEGRLGHQSFVLTAQVDSISGTDFGDIFTATGTTLGAGDTIDGRGGTDTLALLLQDGSGGNVSFATSGATLTSVETLAITTSDTSASPAGAIYSLQLNDSQATAITVAGNAGVNLRQLSTVLTSVDATGVTKGGLTFTSGAIAAAATIKGSAGSANNVDLSASTTGLTYIGGTGADSATVGSGANSVTLGAGANVLTIASGNADINVMTTLRDPIAGDTIKFLPHGSEVFSTDNFWHSGSTFSAALNLRVLGLGDGSTNGQIGFFDFGGNTYVVESNHNNALSQGFSPGTDFIVKLPGLLDLSHSSISNHGLLIG